MLVAEAVGGILTGSLAVLADAGHLLSDVGSIVLALFAAAARRAPGGGAAHLRLPALRGAGGARQRPDAGRGQRRDRDRGDRPLLRPARRSRRAASSRSASSASPATSPRRWSWPAASARTSTSRACCATPPPTRSARSASSSPALWSSPAAPTIVDPIVGLLIAVLVLASSWRLIREPFDVLMEAAPAGLDVEAMGAAICEEEGVRSVHDLHVWTVTAGFGAARRPRRRRPRRRPRPDPAPPRADCCASASGSSTRRCRWRRRPTGGLLQRRERPPGRPEPQARVAGG